MAGPSAHLAFTALAAIVVFLVTRRSLRFGLALTILALVASNGSNVRVKELFLTARWGALFALAAALLVSLRWRGIREGGQGLLILVAVLPTLALVSALWSVDPRLTIERAGTFVVVSAIALACAVRWRRDESDSDELVDGIAASNGAVIVLSVAAALLSHRGVANGELRGVFENANGLGLFLGITSPAVYAALSRRGRERLLVLVVCLFGALTVLSLSRSGMAALVVGTLVYEFGRHRYRRLAILGAFAVVALVLGLFVAKPLLRHEPSSSTGIVASASADRSGASLGVHRVWYARLTGARNEAWGAAAGLIGSRPVLGYGFGTGDRLFDRYPTRVHFVYFEGNNPNNAYLQLALELGLLGGAVGLLAIVVALGRGYRALVTRPVGVNATASIALLTASMVGGIVESILTSAGAPWALLIWPSAAIVLAHPFAADSVARERVSVLPHISFTRGRLFVGAAVAVTVLAAVVAGLALRNGTRAPETPAPVRAHQAAVGLQRSCPSACRVTEVSRVSGSYWWVRLGGSLPRCFLVDLRAKRPMSRLAACAGIPGLLHPHALTVAVRDPQLPYFAPPASNPGGFEAVLMTEIARRLGIHLILWERFHHAVAADLVMHETLIAPAPKVRRVVPYLGLQEALLVRVGGPGVRTVARVRGLRLGVADRTAANYVARGVGPVRKPRRFASADAAMAALRRGIVEGLVLEPSLAKQFADQSGSTLQLEALFPPYAYYALRATHSQALERRVAQAVAAMRSDGRLLRIRREILGLYPAVPTLGG